MPIEIHEFQLMPPARIAETSSAAAAQAPASADASPDVVGAVHRVLAAAAAHAERMRAD